MASSWRASVSLLVVLLSLCAAKRVARGGRGFGASAGRGFSSSAGLKSHERSCETKRLQALVQGEQMEEEEDDDEDEEEEEEKRKEEAEANQH